MKPFPVAAGLAVLCLSCATLPQSAPPPEYSYGATPFGKTSEEVLAVFPARHIKEETTPFIESVGDYALDHFFEGGLTLDQDKGPCFLPNIVRKFVVEKPGWQGVDSVTLYFAAFTDTRAERRLFMVKKTLAERPPGTDFTKLFESLASGITERAGHDPVVHQSRVQSFTEDVHAFYLPALVGVWDQGDVLAFLMVANSPEGNPRRPEVMLVSKDDLARYLERCKVMSD